MRTLSRYSVVIFSILIGASAAFAQETTIPAWGNWSDHYSRQYNDVGVIYDKEKKEYVKINFCSEDKNTPTEEYCLGLAPIGDGHNFAFCRRDPKKKGCPLNPLKCRDSDNTTMFIDPMATTFYGPGEGDAVVDDDDSAPIARPAGK